MRGSGVARFRPLALPDFELVNGAGARELVTGVTGGAGIASAALHRLQELLFLLLRFKLGSVLQAHHSPVVSREVWCVKLPDIRSEKWRACALARRWQVWHVVAGEPAQLRKSVSITASGCRAASAQILV